MPQKQEVVSILREVSLRFELVLTQPQKYIVTHTSLRQICLDREPRGLREEALLMKL